MGLTVRWISDQESAKDWIALMHAQLQAYRFEDPVRWKASIDPNSKDTLSHLEDLVPGLTVTRFMKETRFRIHDYFDVIMDGPRKAGLAE